MKIGILTFHRAINYGAVLQCYALNEVLKSMGHDVEVIDYRPPYIEKYRELFYFNDFKKLGLFAKIKYFCKLPFIYIHKRKVSKVFDGFIDDYLRCSSIVKTVRDIPTDYEIIFFGSDQIWSPQICEGLDPIFWGQFPKMGSKFVTYAASLGGHNHMSSADWIKIKSFIGVFDRISVREPALQQDLNQIVNCKSSLVIDPTLLAPRKIFDDIAIKPKEEKYVLLFTLERSDSAYIFARRIAHERNCKLIRLRAIPRLRNKENLSVREGLSPNEFLGYFKFAEFIITVSFHGTAFSVIFNKDFYTIHSEQEDRAANLLRSVGLENRLIKPDEIQQISNVNYIRSDNKIRLMREESMSFLANCLN